MISSGPRAGTFLHTYSKLFTPCTPHDSRPPFIALCALLYSTSINMIQLLVQDWISNALLGRIILGCSDDDWFPLLPSMKDKSYPLWPITDSLNFLKILPWSGFVKKSTTILSVGQYTTLMSPDFTLYCRKKNLMSTCLELPVHELFKYWVITFHGCKLI